MGNICVIGPRASGKTTYLAALAYWQNQLHSTHKDQNFTIMPQNPESRELAEKAELILCQGMDFEPTVVGQEIKTVDDLPLYSFAIETKTNFWRKIPERIDLVARDYPGEIFEKIADKQLNDPIVKGFVDECFNDVTGCLILLTGWEKGSDSFYNRVMQQFIKFMDDYGRSHDFKLAVAISKCERGEIWSGRIDPETDLFSVHLPKTQNTLKQTMLPHNLQFFALSTFGVLGRNDPRPNREDRIVQGEPASVLRDIPRWKPYNMIEPLYWLSKQPTKNLNKKS